MSQTAPEAPPRGMPTIPTMSTMTNTNTLEGVKMRHQGGVKSPQANRRSSTFPCVDRVGKPLRVRILIAGSEASGKSCIIKRYCEKRFVSKHLATIGIDYGATKIFVDGREVSVHIFDTSGMEIFKEVRNEFYREAHGLLLVFDVSRRESFDVLGDWVKEVRVELSKEGRGLEHTVCFLASNKCDIPPERRDVDEVEARLWAELHGFQYFETSAKTGHGITDMFQVFFSQIVRLAESGLGCKTPKPNKKGGIGGKVRQDRGTQSPANSPPPPQPSGEQAAVMMRIMSGADPWEQLGVGRDSSREEVNKAYRRLAMLLHPDKTEVLGATEAFKVLGQARARILRG